MKTPDQVDRGEFFIGIVWREDFFASNDKRRFPGAVVTVAAVLPAYCEDGCMEIMRLFAGLPADSASQLCSGSSLWVCGVRAKRSPYVRLIDWMPPRPSQKERGANDSR
jgi:hypothetical protein